MSERLFSYGTLRQPEVQQALFGRSVPTISDALPGFVLDEVLITDPEVIATSGSDRHPILRRGSAGDSVAGAFLELTEEELGAADAYEVDDYARVSVILASGAEAWVYVAQDDA
ncbi:gamma-glutamylcyclotransferase family protein [Psychromicrobium sp. YIM B11713]|uniref:gamma-glutamylcyclotransferase family protein n=1 Tax=Psychromicrobium sp. YIM B11713 TaxID=3145233 RepID=UPI00374FB730